MAKIVDLRGTELLTSYYKALDSQFLVQASAEHFRTMLFLGMDIASSPFTIALNKYNETQCQTSIKDTLQDFYQVFSPKSFSDVFDLNSHCDLTHKTRQLDSYSAVLPWSCWSPARRKAQWKKTVEGENKLFGGGGLEHGIQFWGPVSEMKVDIEVRRLIHIFNSIKEKGYIRSDDSDGDIIGSFLVNETGEVRIHVLRGQHRISALAALGYTDIPVRIRTMGGGARLVRRCDVDFFPNVKNGLYSKRLALKVFDDIFYARRQFSFI